MATYVYDDFRVTFTPRPDGSYDVRAVDASDETTQGVFTMPLSEDDLTRAVLQVARSNSRRAAPAAPTTPAAVAAPATRDVGGDGPPAFDAAHLGTLLAGALFTGDIAEHYERATNAGAAKGSGLRLSLSLADAPALVNVPWEFLYRRPRFLASQRHTPVVRWLDTGSLAPPPAIDDTVRILGVIAAPSDLNPLDVEAERRRIEDATRAMCDIDRVELDWLDPATPRRLREVLRDGSYHVLHYVGHSDYTSTGDGVLFLEDDDRKSSAVDSTALANLLSDQTALRLVVLNSCEGARTSLTDPYAGVATTLIQLGVPAVVAMQFEISDEAAIVFGEELYTNLIGRQDPIDAAVAEARKAILIEVDDVEWATPVLFMRDPKVELFSFVVPAAPLPPPPAPIPIGTPDADRADGAAEELEATTSGPLRPVVATAVAGPGDSGNNGSDSTTSDGVPGGRWKRWAAIGAGAAVVAAAVGGLLLAIDGDDDPAASESTATNVDSTARTAPRVPSGEPRPHTAKLAFEIVERNGDIHVFELDPRGGQTAQATDRPGAHDIEADWDPASNHIAFVRTNATTGRCTGICDVVPKAFPDDTGRRVEQLINPQNGIRHHQPAWARDSSLYYAATGACAEVARCSSDIRRATFDRRPAEDDPNFVDRWTVATDELALGGVEELRDIDTDPQDENRIAIVGSGGVHIARNGSVEMRLDGSDGAVTVRFAPDGSRLVALLDDGGMVFWNRDGTSLVTTDMSTMLSTFVAQQGASSGDLDPAAVRVVSISPNESDAEFVALVDQPDGAGPPEIVVVDFGDGGRPVVEMWSRLPASLTSLGVLQGIAR